MKLKAGLAMFSVADFDLADTSVPEDAENNMTYLCREDARGAIAELEKHFELIHKDLINTIDDARQACREYKDADVDLIIPLYLTYQGDDTMVEICRQMKDKPFLCWSICPFKKVDGIKSIYRFYAHTGAPGLLQAATTFKRMNINVDVVLGTPGDPAVTEKFHERAVVLETRKALKSLKMVQVGRRFGSMVGAWFDEARLKMDIGPSVDYVTTRELEEVFNSIPDEEVDEFVKDQLSKYRNEGGVSEEALKKAARASIAIYKIANAGGYGAVAIQDQDSEMHERLGCRPQMTYQKLWDEGIAIGMEGDIDSTLSTWILMNLCEGPALYGEVITYSEEDNNLIIGHASLNDLRLAGDNEITLVKDLECMDDDKYEGCWHQFMCKPGEVTLCSFFEDVDGYQVIVCSGESLPGDLAVPGYGHAKVRIGMTVEEFMTDAVKLGTTQHFTYCNGNMKSRIKMLADMLGFKYYDLDEMHK